MNSKHEPCSGSENRCGSCCTRIKGFGVTAGKTVILKDVNLHIHCGELTAIIGPNGAGKSTLLKAILGEVKHTGEMSFISCKGQNGQSPAKPVIGYVPQQLDFDKGSPVSVFDLFAACKSRRPVWLTKPRILRDKLSEDLERVNAGHIADRRLGELSGGELQRVLLALALDPVPDILLLDEPVSGVDRKGMELFYKTVSELRNKYDLSIILISHDFSLVARYSDRVVLLNKTIKCTGTPDKVFNSAEMKELFSSTEIGMSPDLISTNSKIDSIDGQDKGEVQN